MEDINVQETQKVDAPKETQIISIFEFLRRFALFIIIATILCTVAGFGLAKLKDKPVYTATESVLFFAQIKEGEADVNYDTQYSQYLFATVETAIKTPKFISHANTLYGKEDKILASRILIKSNSQDSLIFSISYTDSSEAAAEEKLQAVIDSAKINLPEHMVSSGQVNIYEVQNSTSISVKDSMSKYLITGFIIGFIGSIIVSFLIVFMDKTVKYKEDLEALSGASVIAVIEKV